MEGPQRFLKLKTLVPQPIVYAPVPILLEKNSEDWSSQLTAESALVIDASSSAILFSKEAELSLPPASTTKLMTALVSREEYALDALAEISLLSVSQPGASVGLLPGEKITVSELLKGILIPSGNDAAHALMMLDESGDTGFLRKMNAKAREFGLQQSFFTNPIGFDDQYQRTSARDLAILAREVMKDPVLKNIVKMKQTTLTDERGFTSHVVLNTNQLLQTNPYIRGIKTGTTPDAGEVLVTEFFKDGRHFIAVVMGSKDRYTDTKLLLNGVLNQYRWYDVEVAEK